MATEAEQKALAHELDFIKGYSQYYNRRAQCMSGFQAQSIREGREKGIPEPDAGVLCLEVLKHSADVEANPQAKAERPDKELLGPYKAFLAEKGFNISDNGAAKLLELYTQQANLPDVQAMNAASFQVTLRSGAAAGQSREFVMTPASALDAAFTKAVLDVYNNKAAAPKANPSAMAREQLTAVTNLCFRNVVEATQGMCTKAGLDQAAHYLEKKKTGTAR